VGIPIIPIPKRRDAPVTKDAPKDAPLGNLILLSFIASSD
jgi:hypothetical protein